MTTMTHDLKVWPEFFRPLIEGRKTFELRRNDRNFQEGDKLCLREWSPLLDNYTHDVTHRRITYVLHGPAFGLEKGFCILGLGPL